MNYYYDLDRCQCNYQPYHPIPYISKQLVTSLELSPGQEFVFTHVLLEGNVLNPKYYMVVIDNTQSNQDMSWSLIKGSSAIRSSVPAGKLSTTTEIIHFEGEYEFYLSCGSRLFHHRNCRATGRIYAI